MVTNLSFSDGFCSMSGGPEHSDFSADPAKVGTQVGYVSWTPGASKPGSFWVEVVAPMPIDPYTGGNIGCPPKGGSCTIEYWFDNSTGANHSSAFGLSQVFSGQSFTIAFTGTAENTKTAPQTGTGHYVWSGSLKLHAVFDQ